MRRKRVKNEGEGYYHLINRCAFKQFLFEDSDKEVFVEMMRRMAAFSGYSFAIAAPTCPAPAIASAG